MLTIDGFTEQFLTLTKGWTWEVEGFLDKNNFVHPIDSDTKVISTVFERLTSPVLRTICNKLDYIVETANQTTYPDFTLSHYDDDTQLTHRIAIDIKTTYSQKSMLFTLGGYNSFLRNDTKNILYPYSTYDEHWIIGFIYNRLDSFEEYDLENMPERGNIPCPYSLDTLFIRHKHEITGLRAGSGNTKNIGSIKTRSGDDFKTANGPFTLLNNPKASCEKYWRDYDKYKIEIKDASDLTKHEDFK